MQYRLLTMLPPYMCTYMSYSAINCTRNWQAASEITLAEMIKTTKRVAPLSQQQHGSLGSHIQADLPSKSLHPGDRFTAKVIVHADRPFSTLTAKVKVSGGLRILKLTKAPKSIWKGDPQINNDGASGVVAIFRDIDANAMQKNPEHVVSFDCVVSSSATAGAHSIELQLVDADDARGDKVSIKVPSILRTRTEYAQSGTGKITVEADTVQGIFIQAAQADVVNTAVLNDKQATYSFSVVGVSASGRYSTIAPSALAGCKTDSAAIQATCSSVLVTGKESGGAAKATLHVTDVATQKKASQHFAVWYPKMPVPMTFARPTLKRVTGWSVAGNGGKCSPNFKLLRSRVTLLATFTQPSADESAAQSFAADVTSILAVRSKASNVATVVREAGGTFVVGAKSGVAKIVADGAQGKTISSGLVQVDAESALKVTKLVVTSVKSISVVAPASVGLFESFPVNASGVSGVLTAEGDRTQLIAVATLSDGTTLPVTPADGLIYDPDGNKSIAIADGVWAQVPRQAESNPNALIKTRWVPSSVCADSDGSVLVSTQVAVGVELPKAQKAEVSVVGTNSGGVYELAHRSDVASVAGVSTSASLYATLLYPGGARKSMSADDRTLVRVLKADTNRRGLDVTRTSSGDLRVSVAEGSTPGPINLLVHFEHEAVNTTLQFMVVAFDRFEVKASPWPVYSNSLQSNADTLNAITGTSPPTFEQALVRCSARLSTGSVVLLNTQQHGMKLDLAGDAAFTLSSQGSNSVLKVTDKDQAVDVHCSVGQQATTADTKLAVKSSNARTSVAKIVRLTLIQGSTRLSQNTALRGEVKVGSATSEVVAEMNNGRVYTQVTHTGQGAFLPGLFQFSTGDKDVVSIDATTGGATLLASHADTVRLQVAAPGADSKLLVGSTAVAANVDPIKDGDVDIGSAEVSSTCMNSLAKLRHAVVTCGWLWILHRQDSSVRAHACIAHNACNLSALCVHADKYL